MIGGRGCKRKHWGIGLPSPSDHGPRNEVCLAMDGDGGLDPFNIEVASVFSLCFHILYETHEQFLAVFFRE